MRAKAFDLKFVGGGYYIAPSCVVFTTLAEDSFLITSTEDSRDELGDLFGDN